jgi:hypothetical protein
VKKYTVLWNPLSESELVTLWESSEDRQAIADAADRIDEALARDPWAIGESRKDDERIAFEFPLGVVYSVSESNKTVIVHSLWQFNPRRH